MERQEIVRARRERASGPSLAGVRLLVTRRPDRSAALRGVLEEAGAAVAFLPLIDFERAPDAAVLSRGLTGLAEGQYAWLVVTSPTTVDALADACGREQTALRECIPAHTRVAAVGAGTAAALKRAGVPVHLVPARQSASGLLAEWPGHPAAGAAGILLPQADIAGETLHTGLKKRRWDVHQVVAYRTVPYPADPATALYEAVAADGGVLSPDAARSEVAAGRINAIVAASPSQVRRLVELAVSLDGCPLVAIGPASHAEALELGLTVAAVAADPGPRSVAAAVEHAVNATQQP
ncbi:uroporphyrinogen-III synthase [Pseudarthrobacter sp. J75]|uniref:uroporphyrinogen-III synthase n=1 Tax=unclassified Pseudarthrobacter TaxID=2647000 RepID=UPI002E822A7B|nr:MULTISPECIES: uroporphyrinogen-III synthase [unclassified Pseudarthrobacter]MEE2521326.1 uroporphyrinogen-III synthase [Pseudarthrobacter sp. J47]MEE2528558.1 uroporphyrinogen-III synthase [Pseudarthrobacter sp. J75]